MRGRAFAKVNLSLRVGAPRGDGLHPLLSLVQSVAWADEMSVEAADADEVTVHGADVGAVADNLGWRALVAMRRSATPRVRLVIDKSIAVAAGLGGGSADAALGLALGAELFGRDPAAAVAAAPLLGADVPFCLAGGCAIVGGIGDELTLLPTPDDYALAIVVPPFELATADVYHRWDQLDGPSGTPIGPKQLPASLRDHAPLTNDLQPAALDLAPELGDWIRDLSRAWDYPVAMSGSGPSLFALFGAIDEATDAITTVTGARSAKAVQPEGAGWRLKPGGTLPPPPWGVV